MKTAEKTPRKALSNSQACELVSHKLTATYSDKLAASTAVSLRVEKPFLGWFLPAEQ